MQKFRREGIDTYSDEENSYVDAILGCDISVDTLDGKYNVSIPSGTQPDYKIRIKNRGVPGI